MTTPAEKDLRTARAWQNAGVSLGGALIFGALMSLSTALCRTGELCVIGSVGNQAFVACVMTLVVAGSLLLP